MGTPSPVALGPPRTSSAFLEERAMIFEGTAPDRESSLRGSGIDTIDLHDDPTTGM